MAPFYSDNGRPGIETRFVIGLLLIKHIYGLSNEAVCERWIYDPYFQHFTGEEFFQHERAMLVLLSAVGYNFRLVLAGLRLLLRFILNALLRLLAVPPALKSAS